MRRRSFLAVAGAAAALPRVAIAQPARVLKFVPQADLSALDPVAASSNPTRNHAYMIYDTLYGVDSALRPHPQMAEGHLLEDDNRVCTITLRDGLTFHDGEKVRAIDAVASLKRWMVRSTAFGDKLTGVIDDLSAIDDRRLRFRLKRPFPFLIEALGSPVGPCAYIMPERIARTDPFKPFKEYVGSGPFRFKADEYLQGVSAAYERFAGYVPSSGGGVGLTAGAKIAHFDRVEWITMEFATGGGAAAG
jgi:peptide/nickel transport system substrate-binding protein